MKLAISAESTLDLSKELLKEFDIHVIPYTFTLGEKEYTDGDITNEEMFELVETNDELPKTSAINKETYKAFYKSVLDKGYDGLIHFALSSGITSSCANAVEAGKEVENVRVVDSKSLSTGIALECINARLMANEGLSLDEVYEKSVKLADNVQASFVLHTIKYLYKGGRCSLLSMIAANALNIRPQILVQDGKMYPGDKYFGNYNRCVKKYTESTLKKFNNPDKRLAFVTYSSADEEMVRICKEALTEAGFERILETKAGSTIASHCGEKCIGILYVNNPE